jgi:hypothetical protein
MRIYSLFKIPKFKNANSPSTIKNHGFWHNSKQGGFFLFFLYFYAKTYVKNYKSKKGVYDKIKGRKIIERDGKVDHWICACEHG